MRNQALSTFFVIMLTCLAQAQDSSLEKEKLLQIVKGYKEFPLYDDTLGMGNIYGLVNYSSDEDYERYAHDSSVVLRYVGFRGVLKRNTDDAFLLLKEFKDDTTEIVFRVPCTIYSSGGYNELLISEYYLFICNTYRDGYYSCDFIGQFWSCGERDINTFKKKRKQLIDFLKEGSYKSSIQKIKDIDRMAKD